MAPDASAYRPCVGIMVFNRAGNVWVGRRFDAPAEPEGPGTWWQMPQGGIGASEDPAAAALRELDEEVALAMPPDHVLGCLDDYPTRSGFVITPVVVWGSAEAVLKPDPREVASIHLLPIDLLTPDRIVLEPGPEGGRPVLALSLPKGLLYAPTAAVLHQFSEVAVHGRATRVDHYEQPRFAWR